MIAGCTLVCQVESHSLCKCAVEQLRAHVCFLLLLLPAGRRTKLWGFEISSSAKLYVGNARWMDGWRSQITGS